MPDAVASGVGAVSQGRARVTCVFPRRPGLEHTKVRSDQRRAYKSVFFCFVYFHKRDTFAELVGYVPALCLALRCSSRPDTSLWRESYPLMSGYPIQPKHVLLVEDNLIVALTLEDELEREGYWVFGPYSSCADALALLAEQTPDVAILDVELRDGPCTELAEELNRRNVPFIVFSGNVKARNTIQQLDNATWIAKPSPFSAVRRAVEEMLDLAQGKRTGT